VKFNFLNPGRETRSQRWTKPYGSSDMHNYLGNEGPTKDSLYSRYAVVAWPVSERLQNTLKFVNLTKAFDDLCALPSVENEMLKWMVQTASEKLMKGNAVKKTHTRWNRSQDLPVPVSLHLFRSVSRLLQNADNPALTSLFFGAFFRYLNEKIEAIFTLSLCC